MSDMYNIIGKHVFNVSLKMEETWRKLEDFNGRDVPHNGFSATFFFSTTWFSILLDDDIVGVMIHVTHYDAKKKKRKESDTCRFLE